MQVLEFIFSLILLAVSLGVAAVAISIAAILAFGLLCVVVILAPLILGLSGGVRLWLDGHDDLGVLVGIGGAVLTWPWQKFLGHCSEWLKKRDDWLGRWWAKQYRTTDDSTDESYSDPMAGKRRRYDKEGNLVGYEDKE